MACITLLSDFGLQDASVAVAKGVLLQHAPGSNIIDISHEIIPFSLQQAAYLLSAAYKKFPAGTCHIALMDIFSERVPKLVLTAYNGHYFLSADNGLMPMAFTGHDGSTHMCFELEKEHTLNDWLVAAGKTILQLQSTPLENLQLPISTLKKTVISAAPSTDIIDTIKCNVLHIDHYDNVVLNINQEQFDALSRGRRFRVVLMEVEDITEISRNYNDVREGNKLCRFNSNGYLEICINRGKAASLFGFRVNSRHNDIKIIFE